MPSFSFITPFNHRAMAITLAKALQLFGMILLLPLLCALAFREFLFCLIFGGMAISVWLLGYLTVKKFPNQPELELREALVVTALAYVLYSLLGALTFLPIASFIDSFFEAMSGFTTTGLSVMNVTALPKSLLFFRAYSQWLGGIGIIVLSLVVLIGPGRTAQQLYASAFSKTKLLGNVLMTARLLTGTYLFLTFCGLVAFILAGMPFFDALLHIMATISTGGFSHYRQSIGHYADSQIIQYIVVVFMLIGATSLTLYHRFRKDGPGHLLSNPQHIILLGFSIIAALVFWALAGKHPSAFTESLFNAVSSLTTTGFTVNDPAQWQDGRKFLSSCLMTIGGMSESTAGGIKILRFILFLKLVAWAFKKMLFPEDTILAIKYGNLAITDSDLKHVFGFFIAYGLILICSTLVVTWSGFPLVDAFFESASALGTVGLSTGVTSPGLSAGIKLLFIFEMWAGRLEILPVMMTLYPGTWLFLKRRET